MLRLLYGTTCFEVMLNRRMPNGTYGGVRGEKKNLPYSIAGALRAEEHAWRRRRELRNAGKLADHLAGNEKSGHRRDKGDACWGWPACVFKLSWDVRRPWDFLGIEDF